MRKMADACNPANLPGGYDLYATYVDGRCAAPGRRDAVRISSLATDAGNVGDCEPGNPGWSVWIEWVKQRRAAGVTPTIYCMDDNYGSSFWDGWRHSDGVQAFANAGVPEPQWWVCHPGATSIPSYAVAVQTELGVSPGYDVSLVLDYVPGWDSSIPPTSTVSSFVSGGSNMFGATGCPLEPTRSDFAYVESNGNVIHGWFVVGVGAAYEDLGAPTGGADPHYGASLCWLGNGDLQVFCVSATNGYVYVLTMSGGLTGNPRTGWEPLLVGSTPLVTGNSPVVPASVGGPTFTAEQKADIQKLLTDLGL